MTVIKCGIILIKVGLRLDSDRTTFRVSVLPDLLHLSTPNFYIRRSQKRTSRLRPRRETTWKCPKIHLDRSPEELDWSSQTGVDFGEASGRLPLSARADCYFYFTRGSVSAFHFWLYLYQNRRLSPSFTLKPISNQKTKPFLIFIFSSQFLISQSVSRVAAVQENDLHADRSVLT